MKPVKLTPAFKDYLWGGTKLRTEFGKDCDFEKIAESWELSTHKDGESTVVTGEHKGKKLSEYIETMGKEVLGKNAEKFSYFPILIKFIDAKDNLSIQVHPDDEYALKNEGEYGKTEMWYILDCEEGAFLYYGFNKEITRDEFADRIKNNTILEVLNKVEVKKGDVFFIKAGTVHAIGKGIVICEIQQNSNTTYRVYDYDRRDKDGNARPLHTEKAIEVSTFTKAPENSGVTKISDDEMCLAKCEYFTVDKVDVNGKKKIKIDENSFRSIIITTGNAKLYSDGEEMELKKGDSVFVPAFNGEIELEGECEAVISYV